MISGATQAASQGRLGFNRRAMRIRVLVGKKRRQPLGPFCASLEFKACLRKCYLFEVLDFVSVDPTRLVIDDGAHATLGPKPRTEAKDVGVYCPLDALQRDGG